MYLRIVAKRKKVINISEHFSVYVPKIFSAYFFFKKMFSYTILKEKNFFLKKGFTFIHKYVIMYIHLYSYT